ncbi:MAG TPA: rhomboid family intramembrane serine protease [Steroidobacteraceae bacterium]
MSTSESSDASETARTSSFVISFTAPGAGQWFVAQSKTRWHWKGPGQLGVEGSDVVLRGRRSRTLWTSAPQEIRFPAGDVIDVAVADRRVSFAVTQSKGAAEPVSLWASDAQAAAAIAAMLPQAQSEHYQEHKAFAQTLAGLNARVIVIPALIGINVAAFVAVTLGGANFFQPSGNALISWGSNFGPLTLGGQWWRLFTSMFLHFGILHILLNMWAFWNIGPLAERLFGSRRFLVLYVFAGLCGSEASLLWNPAVNSAGASGAIFGVLGGLLAFMLNPKTKIPASVSASQRNSALAFIAYNLINGVSHAGIDNACHIGGLIGGLAMGWLLSQPLDAAARQRSSPGLLTGICTGAIVLFGLSWPLTHMNPEKRAHMEFSRGFYFYSLRESVAVERAKNLQTLLSNHQISDQQWGQRTLAEVLPEWNLAAGTLAQMEVPSNSTYYRAKSVLADYLNHFQIAVRDAAVAMRDGDTNKEQVANEEFAESAVLQKQAINLLRANL